MIYWYQVFYTFPPKMALRDTKRRANPVHLDPKICVVCHTKCWDFRVIYHRQLGTATQDTPSFFPVSLMTDTFHNNNNRYDSANDSNAIPDLFPPLGEALQFDSMTISTHQDKHSDNASDDVLWNEYRNNNNNTTSSSTPPIQSSVASSSNSNNNNNNATAESSSGGVFNISWGGGNDRPPAELHLDQETELVSRKPLPKPRGVRRLPEPEPAEDGTLDEDTLRRRRVCIYISYGCGSLTDSF